MIIIPVIIRSACVRATTKHYKHIHTTSVADGGGARYARDVITLYCSRASGPPKVFSSTPFAGSRSYILNFSRPAQH